MTAAQQATSEAFLDPDHAPDAGGRAKWIVAALLAPPLAYLLARYVGLGPEPGPWAYWPINGFLCGMFFRRPYREWPVMGLAAAATQVIAIFAARGDLAGGATVVGALIAFAQAALAAGVLREVSGDCNPLESPRDLAWFVALAVIVAPLVTTPISASTYARGLHLSWSTAWPPLFAGNSLSMLIFAPPVMYYWRHDRRLGPWRADAFERFTGHAVIVLLTLFIFAGSGSLLRYAVVPYALFPMLAWSALRCGPRSTSLAIVVIATTAAWCTARDIGPFAPIRLALPDRILELQAYLALLALTGLLLSALSEQGRRAFQRLFLQGAIRDSFFDSSVAVLVLKDLSGRTVIANRAYNELMGAPDAGAAEQGSHDPLSARDAAIIRARDQIVLERGRAINFDEEYTVNGRRRQFLATRFPVRNADGEIAYTGVIARDVTVERELAERLQRAQRVEMVGHLAAGVVHDLNNLLSTISLSANLLHASSGSSAESREIVNGIDEAANSAARLTRRLLALGRSSQPEQVPIAVDAALQELEPMLRVLVRGLVELRFELAAGDARVMADPLTIEQVVLNLVSNARDAVSERGRIVVRTERLPVTALTTAPTDNSAAEWLRLLVIDTGEGMDAATMSMLFEPFFSTKGERGTGLGLYTSSLLVRQAGGTMRATSQPGNGTTFIVELPILS